MSVCSGFLKSLGISPKNFLVQKLDFCYVPFLRYICHKFFFFGLGLAQVPKPQNQKSFKFVKLITNEHNDMIGAN